MTAISRSESRGQLQAAIKRAFADAGAIYSTEAPAAAILAAADDYATAERDRFRAQLDGEFVDDDEFEKRLRTIMRRDPQLLRNRIHGDASWL